MKRPIKFVMTQGLAAAADENPATGAAIYDALRRFGAREWGDLSQEDKEANDRDLAESCGRVLARYETPSGDIYIIFYPGSEEPATILFCDEY